MAYRPRVENKSVVGMADREPPDVDERMAERRADVVEQRAGRACHAGRRRDAEAVERHYAEMARKRVERGIRGKGPCVGRLVVAPPHLGGAIAVKRLFEPAFILELLNEELAGGKVEKRGGKSARRRDVVVGRFVKQPFFRHRAGRDDSRYLATHQPLCSLRVFDLVYKRGGLPSAYELRKVGVERMVWNAAHRLVSAARERRAEDRRRDYGVLSEHLVEIAEPEHQYRARRHLALQRKVLPLHRCQVVCHCLMSTASYGKRRRALTGTRE